MNMKRIFAIALLVLFVLLLLNIFIIHFMFELSIGAYVVLLVIYFFYSQTADKGSKKDGPTKGGS